MTLYEELQARGLVAQITDDEIIDLINNGKATFYIGFDCTADSLTAGHFMALTLMKRLQFHLLFYRCQEFLSFDMLPDVEFLS